MMRANNSAVDHLESVWNGPALVQGFEYVLPQPSQRPAPELAVNTGPFAKLFGQISPR